MKPRARHFGLLAGLLLVAIPMVQAQISRSPQVYRDGVAALEADDVYRSIELFKEALTLNPQYLEPMVKLAQAYYYLDEYDEALRYVKQAIALAKDSPQLLNIHGRILLALGKPDEAAAIFRSILKTEPYNIDASLGLAEFSLAKGDELGAMAQYLKSKQFSQSDRRILLSLAIMYEAKGDSRTAEKFLLDTLQAYPENALVQAMAAEYYLRSGRLKDAEFNAQTALALRPGYDRALQALGNVYLFSRRYPEAVAVMDQLIRKNSKNAKAWYIRGLAQRRLNKFDEAVASFDRGLVANPADEVMRVLLEDSLIRGGTADPATRNRYADYHFEQASQFRKKNLNDRAAFHYLRGLQVAPTSLNGRIGYATFLKQMNLGARLFEQLKVLQESLKTAAATEVSQVLTKAGLSPNFIKDYFEIYQSLLSRSVSANWHVNQFLDFDRDPLLFRVFTIKSRQNLEHADGDEFLASYAQDLLGSSDKISFASTKEANDEVAPRTVASEADAFRMAREEGSDYYVLCEFQDSNDDFQATINLYLSRTGSLIRSYKAYRTGNFRVENAIWQDIERLQSEAPLRGSLQKRQVNDGLINIGSGDGVKVGDTLHLVAKDGYVLQGGAPGFVFSQDKKLGTFTVTKVDERVAEGTIKREGFFDKVNIGDIVLRDGESVAKPQDATSNFPFLYNRIRGIH